MRYKLKVWTYQAERGTLWELRIQLDHITVSQGISPFCCFSFDCLLQVLQPNGSATINHWRGSLSSTNKVGDHCVSVMISVIDSFEHLNSRETLSEMRFECIIKRHLFLLILFHFLSLLCRFIIVSGALWMWMSALPYCLPLRNAPAPSANQPLHLQPLPSPTSCDPLKKNSPPTPTFPLI